MSYYESIEIYERSYTLDSVYMMYREQRLIFPAGGVSIRYKRMKELNDTMETIRMGVPLPAFYAVELQNGTLLVLDNTDRLQTLLEFLDHRLRARIYFRKQGIVELQADELMQRNPMLFDRIVTTKIIIYVVDYNTPLYMQMQMTKMIGEFSPTKEQVIREIIYGASEMDHLKRITAEISCSPEYKVYRRESSPLERFRCLYMCMIWLIYAEQFNVEDVLLEQHILDWTLYEICDQNEALQEFKEFARDKYGYMNDWLNQNRHVAWIETYKRSQKLYGYLICAMHLGWQRDIGEFDVLDILMEEGFFREVCKQVNSAQIDIDNIWANIQELDRIVR